MPPKKKETSKKPEAAKTQTLINGLTKEELSKEQIEEHIVRLREELEREKEERNYFQLERDKIQTFREGTDRKLERVKAELKNLEKAIEDDEAHHQVEIKVFKQKMKHLLCEHQNTISELEADVSASAKRLQDEQDQLEAELCEEILTILTDTQTINSEDVFRELQLKHDAEMAAARDKWERLVAETVAKYKTEKQQLEKDQDNTLKSLICERELLWNSHLSDLREDLRKGLREAEETFRVQDEDTTAHFEELEKCRFKTSRNVEKVKETWSALLKENKELTLVAAEANDELSLLERKAKFSPLKKAPIRNPHEKALKDLKRDHDELDQKFCKLQIELDELRSSVPRKIYMAQDQADESLRPLEDELQALAGQLEETQAQLHSVLSAPNLDQTAVTEITYQVEKDLESKNSAIKDLRHRIYLISQSRRAMLLKAEAKRRAPLK
ncbi:dynein regulatory complex subunit 4 [Fundulus heteroclitus]|uniref:dynein regulatory complex subunit 4 n=1 Tax=Fundulus heteroclitus TaxID=8078 RepID=UPI00165B3BBB|nr:dynein regulatory complex subunit 4 [Fundulus heteroclitus]